MNIKAILSDVDGTLIDYYGTYNKRVPSLIHSLQAQGIQFGVATGKAYFGEIAHVIKELDLSSHNIVNGGGMIIDWKTGKTPWHQPVSEESTKKIAEYLNSTGLVFSLETKTAPYQMRPTSTPAYDNWVEVIKYTLETIPQGVLKILVHSSANKLSEKDVLSHIKNIEEICKDVAVIKFAFKEYFGIDITSEKSTKHTAVLEYGQILGISPNEIVGIGDGYNDYPLFTACGYKIAMGNAPTQLKEIADKIVDTAANGGMVQALNHIALL